MKDKTHQPNESRISQVHEDVLNGKIQTLGNLGGQRTDRCFKRELHSHTEEIIIQP